MNQENLRKLLRTSSKSKSRNALIKIEQIARKQTTDKYFSDLIDIMSQQDEEENVRIEAANELLRRYPIKPPFLREISKERLKEIANERTIDKVIGIAEGLKIDNLVQPLANLMQLFTLGDKCDDYIKRLIERNKEKLKNVKENVHSVKALISMLGELISIEGSSLNPSIVNDAISIYCIISVNPNIFQNFTEMTKCLKIVFDMLKAIAQKGDRLTQRGNMATIWEAIFTSKLLKSEELDEEVCEAAIQFLIDILKQFDKHEIKPFYMHLFGKKTGILGSLQIILNDMQMKKGSELVRVFYNHLDSFINE